MSDHTTGEGEVGSRDGLLLSFRSWLPASERAVVLIVHGVAEHSGRYAHVGQHLAALGYACYALDYRGHGRSPGVRAHIHRFDDYLADVTAMREHLRAAHPHVPLVLLGHSQGGLIVLLEALTAPAGLAAVIATSPFLGIHPASRPPAVLAAAARVLSRTVPKLRIASNLDTSQLSRSPEVVAAYEADPLVTSKVSARWFTEINGAHARALALAPRLMTPTLVMQAGADRLVDPGATRRWVEAAPAALVEYVEWDGFYHEILNEPEKADVLTRIESWLAVTLGCQAQRS
jgi:acylglycerol lipase